MVRHRLPFQQLEPFLPAQLPKDFADLAAISLKKLLASVLWHKYYVVLALPLHVGLATPFILDPPRPLGPSSGEDLFTFMQETASPYGSHRRSRSVNFDLVAATIRVARAATIVTGTWCWNSMNPSFESQWVLATS